MCAGALVLARVDRLVFGATDPKAGFAGSLGNLVQDPRLNHRLEVTSGVGEEEAGRLLRAFFAYRAAPGPGEGRSVDSSAVGSPSPAEGGGLENR